MPIDLSKLKQTQKGGKTFYLRKDTGKPVCGSKLRGKAENVRCAQRAISPTNGRCKFHGKDAGRPIEHGRFSEALGPLRSAYEAWRESGELRALEPGLAISSMQVERMLRRLPSGDTPEFRLTACDMLDSARGEIRDWLEEDELDPEGNVLGFLETLRVHLQAGLDEDATWDEALRQVERRQVRIEKALGVQQRAEETLTPTAVLATLRLVVDVILRRAPSELAQKIIREIRSEIARPGARGGLGGILDPNE